MKFNSASVIAASYNVSSVTDNGVGDWTVNIGTDMSSANYCGVAFGAGAGGAANLTYNLIAAATAGTFRISAPGDPSLPDEIYAVFFGDQ